MNFMARTVRSRATLDELDLHGWSQPSAPRPGRPVKHDLSGWRVIDDWPDRVPVTAEEVDVFEAWFGDVLDELFGPA